MNKRQLTAVMKTGDICPECGEAAVVNEEGCPSNVRPSAMLVDIRSVRRLKVGRFESRGEVISPLQLGRDSK